MYVERKVNSVRVYVKILSGDWVEQSNIGRFQLRRKANVSIRGAADVDRAIGTVTDINNSIVLGNSLVGELIVFSNKHIASSPDVKYPILDTVYIALYLGINGLLSLSIIHKSSC